VGQSLLSGAISTRTLWYAKAIFKLGIWYAHAPHVETQDLQHFVEDHCASFYLRDCVQADSQVFAAHGRSQPAARAICAIMLHKPHPSILNLVDSQEIRLTAVECFVMKPVADIDLVKRACLVAWPWALGPPYLFSARAIVNSSGFRPNNVSIVQQAT
jgi:hypothetical protein